MNESTKRWECLIPVPYRFAEKLQNFGNLCPLARCKPVLYPISLACKAALRSLKVCAARKLGKRVMPPPPPLESDIREIIRAMYNTERKKPRGPNWSFMSKLGWRDVKVCAFTIVLLGIREPKISQILNFVLYRKSQPQNSELQY